MSWRVYCYYDQEHARRIVSMSRSSRREEIGTAL